MYIAHVLATFQKSVARNFLSVVVQFSSESSFHSPLIGSTSKHLTLLQQFHFVALNFYLLCIKHPCCGTQLISLLVLSWHFSIFKTCCISYYLLPFQNFLIQFNFHGVQVAFKFSSQLFLCMMYRSFQPSHGQPP
jgi:hypothetical protein